MAVDPAVTTPTTEAVSYASERILASDLSVTEGPEAVLAAGAAVSGVAAAGAVV